MGEAWLANQMWDHYQFSGDREFLRRQAYPAMKEAAQFILDTLVPGPEGGPAAGYLVTNPSTSPENQYLLNGGRHHLTYAATMDLQLIGELFEACGRAAALLGVDAGFRDELRRAGQRLPPPQVGRRGQLQEWIEDYEEAEPAHRHVSHLYSLYPGNAISLDATPALAAAARRSLELRGDGGTGWSSVWRVALWARLRDPELVTVVRIEAPDYRDPAGNSFGSAANAARSACEFGRLRSLADQRVIPPLSAVGATSPLTLSDPIARVPDRERR